MDIKRVVELQSERGVKSIGSEVNKKSLESVIGECRRFIQSNLEGYREMDALIKRERIKNLIMTYVMTNNPLVEGFIDEENRLDVNRLVNKLIEEILDYGILTRAILDPSVYEIRVNGKEIKVEIRGRVQDYTDENGNVLSFESVEQQDIVIRKLLGDVRLTPKDAIVNARTVEGYRVAAVHNSAIGADPEDPQGSVYHAFVLRKFKKEKWSLSDLARFGTISDNMARFLRLLPAGGLTFVTVGPTASGKTTLNNAILQAVPPSTRTILLQNPSEIDLRFKDVLGRVYNDVLHLEAKEKENPTHSDPTMENLMAHILRLSPTFVCVGEMRKSIEFKLGMQIMQAGHPINATYHAEDAYGAIERYLTAYLAESGNEPPNLALASLSRLLNIVIVQKFMRDGTRKVIQVSEVVPVDVMDIETDRKSIINDLFIFDIDGEPEYNEFGEVIKISGRHKRVGKLTERTVRKFRLEGVRSSDYEFMLEDPKDNEIETYTGNI